MDHQHMDTLAMDQNFGVQQAALFKAVVRHVFMLVRQNWPTRQHRVSMFAVPGHCIGLINRGITFWR
jgi:hypothetical protein